ncbi:hypothetical protein NiCM35_07735 [Niallia circulans]|uniref:hypothetical protein n=1 Tax=Niallia circulans TaxID=1397 RepID=UPI003D99C564
MSTITENDIQQYMSVYQIDNITNTINTANIGTTDFQSFLNKVCIQDLNAKNKKSYKYSRSATELVQIVNSIIDNLNEENFMSIFESKTKRLAEKLLYAQKLSMQRYPNVQAPKKGSLAVVLLIEEEKLDILISKIDQANFLNLEDSTYKAGLPEEKATQKTCSISYKLEDEKYELVSIEVSDTQAKIATFWSTDFLELTELHNNEKNTLNAFNAIDSVLTNYVKKKSPRDYTEFRNNLTGYFTTNTSFKLDDMINYVIGDYKPSSIDVNTEVLKNKFKQLPTNKNFDAAFDIDNTRIKNRFKRSYKVSDKIELRTSDYIEDLKKVILAKEDDESGEKVLVIKNISNKLYEQFKE